MDNTETTPAFRLDREPDSLMDLLALAGDAMKDHLDRRAEAGGPYPLPEARAEWGRALAARVAQGCRPFWQRLYAASTPFQRHVGFPDRAAYDGYTVEGFAILVLTDLVEEDLHRRFYPQIEWLDDTPTAGG